MECEEECNLQIVNVVSLHPNAIEMASAKAKEKHADRNENLLLKLIKSLVNVKDKDNEQMVLTNLQVMKILRKEFNIKLKKKSELEVDIYMNILKHFLKKWPQWVELENIGESDSDNLDDILDTKCRDLKAYLADALKTAENEMGPLVAKYNQEQALEEQAIDKEVAIEIVCSRSQLNQLIFRQPNPEFNNTIFNIVERASPSISLQHITLKHIINWPDVHVKIVLPGFECLRWNSSSVERTIVNMKLKENANRLEKQYPLNINAMYHRKSYGTRSREPHKEYILGYLDELTSYLTENKVTTAPQMEAILYILQQYRMDFENMDMHVQFGEYKFYLNSFKYVRYSSEELPGARQVGKFADKFDLRLEEIMTPCNTFKFMKLKITPAPSTSESKTKFTFDEHLFRNSSWLVVDCTICGMPFYVGTDCSKLEAHFMDCHQTNLEWNCSGCQKKFSVLYLTEHRWYHNCEANSD